MKPSEAMLKGFEIAGGRQCHCKQFVGDEKAPDAVCAMGAYHLGMTGSAVATQAFDDAFQEARKAFVKKLGFGVIHANDTRHFSIPHIAGILASEGY